MALGTGEANGDEIVSQINITPLTDIFVVLLIIFMVTAEVTRLQGPEVKPPVEGGPARTQDNRAVEVTVQQNLKTFVDGKESGSANLAADLRSALDRTEKREVVIRSHPELSLDQVMAVYRAAELADARGISIATRFQER